MIDAYRRGYQAGSEEARQGSVDGVEAQAKRVFAIMEKYGYAHLHPRSEFIRGFVTGVDSTRKEIILGIFSRIFGGNQTNSELPQFIEEGDELIGQHAVDNQGHEGVIDLVYVFSDGHKSVDIRSQNGLGYCGLNPDEYTLK